MGQPKKHPELDHLLSVIQEQNKFFVAEELDFSARQIRNAMRQYQKVGKKAKVLSRTKGDRR